MNQHPPTRYRTHPEALKGSFLWPLRLKKNHLILVLTTFITCALLPNAIGDGNLAWPTWTLIFGGIYLTAWPTGGVVLYLANVFAGGIKSRKERERRQRD